MSSRKRARKAEQQRLAFEPVANADSSSSPLPGLGLSPAKVRFSSPSTAQQGGPSRRQLAVSSPLKMSKRKERPKQQTLESLLGKGKVRMSSKKPDQEEEEEDRDDLPIFPSSTRKAIPEGRRRAAPSSPRSTAPCSSIPRSTVPRSTAPPSSMFGSHTGRGRTVVLDNDSESPVEEDGAVNESDGEGPLRHEMPRAGRPDHSSMPYSTMVTISSDDEDRPEDEDSEDEVQGHVRSSQSLPKQAIVDDDDDDEDDEDELPVRTPRSSMPRHRRQVIDEDEDEDEEGEHEVVQTPAKRRRLTRQKSAPVSSDSEDESLVETPKNKVWGKGKRQATSATRDSSPPTSTARATRSGARRHRSAREKKMELLRRHRAGEKHLTIEDLDTSAEEDAGGLYDTDSDHQVLEVFDDDESEAQEAEPTTKKARKEAKKKAKKALKKAAKGRRDREASVIDEDANSDDENFLDDDDDTLGVPDEALHLMPLEFTRSAIKPLKDHFKDAVSWLVHRRINPSFDKNNEVYSRAWRKLNDEVTGLANSKFISSVWRPNFHKALKARPYIEQQELGFNSIANELESCQACGRSGHPATWSIRPYGKPYDPNTLDEVESDSEDEDEEDEEDEDEKGDRDITGNIIPPETKEFYVGQTCNSNAETAHSLMHWRVGLRDWVDGTLEGEGLFEPNQVLEREQMRPKLRKRMAEEIVTRWDERGVIKSLFGDFQHTIEGARNKDPTKVARGRRF